MSVFCVLTSNISVFGFPSLCSRALAQRHQLPPALGRRAETLPLEAPELAKAARALGSLAAAHVGLAAAATAVAEWNPRDVASVLRPPATWDGADTHHGLAAISAEPPPPPGRQALVKPGKMKRHFLLHALFHSQVIGW